jgi:DNA primase
LRSKWFTDNDIVESSLAKKFDNGDISSFFRNRITFPIFDIMWNIVWFSARILNPDDNPKYLNSAEHKAFEKSKILYWLNFAKNSIREHQKIIIVEWQMDVLGLAKMWIPVGVATSWTSLTDEHIKVLKRYTENIYLMFDNDQAWQKATQRALKLFYQQNLFPKIISIPEPRKDIDEISNEENGKEIFEECLKKAKDWFQVLYERLRASLDMSSPVDKQKLINTLFDVIISVNSLAIQEHYKDVLAKNLWFAFEVLNAQFKSYKANDWKFQVLQTTRKQEQQQHTEKFQLEREWLYATLFYQDLIQKYIWWFEITENFIKFSELLSKTDTDNIFSKAINNNLSEDETKKIEELTLRRDQQLESFSDEKTRYQHIIQTLLPLIQTSLQLGLKNPKISAEEKTELLKLRRVL